MGALDNPFEALVVEEAISDFELLSRRPAALPQHSMAIVGAAVTARFHGFDLDDRPQISGLAHFPGEVLGARSTVPLRRAMVGADVVVLFDHGDPRKPIIVGVVQDFSSPVGDADQTPQKVSIQADDERFVVSAEREIVLRCGDASITLTRAGKVIIKGNYIVSRSTGYNKIKGAAIDIN